MSIVKIMLITVISALILLLIAFFLIREAKENKAELPVLYEVPEFEFTDMNGNNISLEQMKGKVSVIDFIFTRCPGPCPMMSSKMASLYEIYRGYQQVQFLSFTVDPEYDSLSILKTYAESFGVDDDRWKFLHAKKSAVSQLYEQGFKLAGDLPAYHSTKFILVDQNAMIRGYYSTEDDISFNILKTHLKDLAKQIP